MQRDSMIFYRSFWDALSTLESEERVYLLDAILSFGFDGKEPDNLQGHVLGMFGLIKPQIEANNKRYVNGTKGGRPRNQIKTKDKPKNNQMETISKPNDNDNDNDNDNVNVNQNNECEMKRDNPSLKYCRSFEQFWGIYPRKKEKAKAYKYYQARLRDGFSEDELLKAAAAYAEECRKDRRQEQYIKLGSTFLSASTPFTDYLNSERGGVEDAATSGSFKL